MRHLVSAALLPTLLSACGAGAAGIVVGTGGSGGGSTPALEGFSVEGSKRSPVRLRLETPRHLRVELVYDAGAGESPMSLLPAVGVVGNTVQLAAGTNELEWDFETDLGTLDLTRDVALRVKQGDAAVVGGTLVVDVGNDPPVVQRIEPLPTDSANPQESSGIVEVVIELSDSSGDVVGLDVEWRLSTDPPDTWRPATEAGMLPAGIKTPDDGSPLSLSFFWSTNDDLPDTEGEVVLRAIAEDPAEVGLPVESTGGFLVDNNEEPIVQLGNDSVVANPDERWGIPVPFRVLDEEQDDVRVVFQWRLEGETFPDLPPGRSEVERILADPGLRREHRICTPYPRYARGRVLPVDQTSLRLPELAVSESWILAAGIEGLALELLRPSGVPGTITSSWPVNPLSFPIAALPLRDGLTALVLDLSGGSGRLREIELATGQVLVEVSMLGPGTPTAIAFERPSDPVLDPGAVLVALDQSGGWRIERVELEGGSVSEVAASPGPAPSAVRGLASVGPTSAVLTVGSELLRIDYADPSAAGVATLADDMATPWGVVVDPLAPNAVYVAERDAMTPLGPGRIVALDLDSHGRTPLSSFDQAGSQYGLETPTLLAIEDRGTRLVAVVGNLAGPARLVGLDLGARGRNVVSEIGPLASPPSSIATGGSGLRLVSSSVTGELLAGGGIEQRHDIVDYEAESQEVGLATGPAPPARPGQVWRLRAPDEKYSGKTGVSGTFVWDSSADVAGSRPVFLRAQAFDLESGPPDRGDFPKALRSGLDVDPVLVGGPGVTPAPLFIAMADLDADGDRDLVSTTTSGVLVLFIQEAPGVFSPAPQRLGGPGVAEASWVSPADVDGDGWLDLITANRSSDDLTIFFQESPGTFGSTPLRVGGPGVTDGLRAVAAADLDGDGDVDLASVNREDLTVFFQRSARVFDTVPLRLGGPGVTSSPGSVASSDLDGDGDLDLVTANSLGDDLTIFFQDAPGAFSISPLRLGGPGILEDPFFVTSADLDGDGDQDLVSTTTSITDFGLVVFFQDAPGVFANAPLRLGEPGKNGLPVTVAVADVDGDEDQDLVAPDYFGNDLTVFLQESPGAFGATPMRIGVPGALERPVSCLAGDLDGDGDVDLVAANPSGPHLAVFLQESPGSFTSPPTRLGGAGITIDPTSVAAADLDGDGDLDLVSTNTFVTRGSLTVFFQEAAGVFARTPLVVGGSGLLNGPFSVAAGDYDGDGDMDLVTTSFGDDDLAVFFQEGPGSFSDAPLRLGGPGVSNSPRWVTSADLDGDGDRDLVSANADDLTIFFQEAPGSFGGTPLRLDVNGDPLEVIAADLDGDGRQDLAAVDSGADELVVFFQEGPGSFTTTPMRLGGAGVLNGPGSVVAADLDGDGDLDLLAANRGDDLVIFFQEGPRVFTSTPSRLGGAGVLDDPVSVGATDFDGDGDLDVVSANLLGGDLTVFFQEAPGLFGATPLRLGAGALDLPVSIEIGDLDGDGDPDLVSTNNGGDDLTIFWGGR